MCHIEKAITSIEYKKRIRSHGIEFFGKTLEEPQWRFCYIRSFNGEEVFFYPFETSDSVKAAIIDCILSREKIYTETVVKESKEKNKNNSAKKRKS